MDMRMRIKELCSKEHISMNKLEEALSFGKGYISKLGTSVPNVAKISKIADYFNVSIDFLIGLTDLIVCEECDFTYCPLEENDLVDHKERHNKWKKAEDKYGKIYSHSEREEIKQQYRTALQNQSSPLKERVTTCNLLFRSFFSRSLVGCDFNLAHPSFETYSSMLLNQTYWEETLGKELYNAMVSIYGTTPGIDNRHTYFDMNKLRATTMSVDQKYQETIDSAKKKGYTPEDIDLALSMLELAKKAK